jgi:hypothetical protein
VLAAQEDARTGEPAAPAKVSRSSIAYSIAGGALVLIGIAGAYYAYTQYLAKSAPVYVPPSATAPIFVNEREEVTGTSTALLGELVASVAKPLPAGAVRFLYTPVSTTTDNSVFSSLLLPAPGVLLRNIVAQGSMAGVVNAGAAQSPFFILAVTSYGDTFAGMLSWEPSMVRDLGSLFPPYPQAETPAPVATTTSTTTKPSAKSASTTAATTTAPDIGFRDEVIATHDVRIYRDAQGRSMLLYGYWNQTTLVIARDEAAFSEILDRLATSRGAQ